MKLHNVKLKVRERSSEKQQSLTNLLACCQPRDFINFPGWGNIAGIKSFMDLPKSLKDYLSFLASISGLGLPVKIASVGPRAEDKIDL